MMQRLSQLFLGTKRPSCGRTVQIMSDLHLELNRQYASFDFPVEAPILVLGGDIGRLVDYDMFLPFLARQTERFDRVFLVLDNHEFYEMSYEPGVEKARQLEQEETLSGKLVVLDRRRWDDPDSKLTILGCTMWSSIAPAAEEEVTLRVSDFKYIRDWSVAKHNARHREDVAWLSKSLGELNALPEDEKRVVFVVTHHAPCVKGASRPEHEKATYKTAFSTDIVQRREFAGVASWMFGHTHFTTEFSRNGVRLVANQRGVVAAGQGLWSAVVPCQGGLWPEAPTSPGIGRAASPVRAKQPKKLDVAAAHDENDDALLSQHTATATMPPRILPPTALNCRAPAQAPVSSLTACLAGLSLQTRHASILGSLANNPGAVKNRKRVGRGPSAGQGKTSGRGNKGQGQHGKVKPWFQGGQTPLIVKHGRMGFNNFRAPKISQVNLDQIQSWIDQGRLDPTKQITPKELIESGIVGSVKDGVKVLSRGGDALKQPIDVMVSRVSASAIAAIEAAGGKVLTRYYTKLAIRRLLTGESVNTDKPLPVGKEHVEPVLAEARQAPFRYRLPDPTSREDIEYYRDPAHRGYLSHKLAPGESPSLYFRVPGVQKKKTEVKKKEKKTEETIW